MQSSRAPSEMVCAALGEDVALEEIRGYANNHSDSLTDRSPFSLHTPGMVTTLMEQIHYMKSSLYTQSQFV